MSVLRVDEGSIELSDGYETMIAARSLVPVACARGGEWIPAQPDGGPCVAA